MTDRRSEGCGSAGVICGIGPRRAGMAGTESNLTFVLMGDATVERT